MTEPPTRRARPPARSYRLTGTGAFDTVFRTGRRREGSYLQVVYAPAAGATGRVGYVIAKKALPLAVDRNRLRRMLRPIVAAARSDIEAYDLIVRLKKPCSREALRAVALEAQELLGMLRRAVR